MQNSTSTSQSECDKQINAQMNRDLTTPNSGTMPRNTTPPPASMPMDRGTPPNMGMPKNRATTPATPINRGTTSGTPINRGTSPRAGMPMEETMPPTTGMPMYGMPINTPYNAPMGVPLYPLYGYDNCEDLDRDMKYLQQLYPSSARRIQGEINNECDKLEYDGSVMFDEYPDRVTLDRIVDRVYERIKDMEEVPLIEANSVYFAPRRRQNILRDFVSIILLNELFNRRRRHRSRRRWF